MTDLFDLAPPLADARLPYGPDPFHFGDLRLPAGDGAHPLVVNVHGGFWRARYDLAHAGHLCAALAAVGIATWNVEYRRLGNPGGGWPGTFEDVVRALAFVRELAVRYPLDLARVAVMGHSAGGHLALWVAGERKGKGQKEGGGAEGETGRRGDGEPATFERSSVRAFERSSVPALRAVVSLAGVADLRRAWALGLSGGAVAELLGGAPDEVPARYAAASPIERLPLGVPTLLVHGAEDEDVPFELSQRYHQAARVLGDEVVLTVLPGAGHFAPLDPRAASWPMVERVIQCAVRGNADQQAGR